MKLKSVLLAFLLLSAGLSHAQQNSIVGTWKLVSGKMTTGDSTVSYGTNTGESMKIITPTHFAVMSKSTDGTPGHFAGGRVKMDNTNYTETLEYSSVKDMLNNNVVFTYKVEGNRCHIVGGTNNYKFDEIWEKVQ